MAQSVSSLQALSHYDEVLVYSTLLLYHSLLLKNRKIAPILGTSRSKVQRHRESMFKELKLEMQNNTTRTSKLHEERLHNLPFTRTRTAQTGKPLLYKQRQDLTQFLHNK